MIKNMLLPNLWNDAQASLLGEPELLRYRSNLLGSDKRITNFAGGNTSAKVRMSDPLTGEEVEVLWVKGSGGDLGSIGLDGFATLYLYKLHALKALYRGLANEDQMMGYLPHCVFNLNPRPPSIDTPLHAFIPHRHVDHMHPDAVIAIAACRDGERLTQDIFDGKVAWLPWQRPGFDLGLKIGALAQKPGLVGVILGGHGLFTWGESAKTCYENTLAVINSCIEWLAIHNTRLSFGGSAHAPLIPSERRRIAARLMPLIRGKIGKEGAKIGHFDDSESVLQFVCSRDLNRLAPMGTSCPDHFLRTKIRPLVCDFDPATDSLDALFAQLDQKIESYRQDYIAYYERCKHADSPPMRDPNAVVYLIPSVGMITFGRDKATARLAAEYYQNAINVMREAEGVSTYVALDEQEAFNIEYWSLEEAKIKQAPKAGSLEGKVALITGGAGGIGKATAVRLLVDGACVVLTDIDEVRLAETETELRGLFGQDRIRAFRADATLDTEVAASIEFSAVEFGGLDILVANAGIASSAPIEETTLAMWNQNLNVMATGYFLVVREAVKLFKLQNLGGSIVFIASKNGLAASPNTVAYSSAKAAEIHLARVLAMELAPAQIRVNVVNPDAVLRGSKIWSGSWGAERAAAYKIPPEELEEFYRQRSLLKRSVFPEDVAEAVFFFASDSSAKSTGNILNVDAGNAAAFPR